MNPTSPELPQARLYVVLVEPEIPPNTGNIARLCAATGASLHLVEPLGFELSDRMLKRSGMDYWKHVNWRVWPDFAAAETGIDATAWHFFTTKATTSYWDASYQPGDALVFGRETKGLPESLITAQAERTRRIPMSGPAEARSLNLATSVGIAVYEALRQCAT